MYVDWIDNDLKHHCVKCSDKFTAQLLYDSITDYTLKVLLGLRYLVSYTLNCLLHSLFLWVALDKCLNIMLNRRFRMCMPYRCSKCNEDLYYKDELVFFSSNDIEVEVSESSPDYSHCVCVSCYEESIN